MLKIDICLWAKTSTLNGTISLFLSSQYSQSGFTATMPLYTNSESFYFHTIMCVEIVALTLQSYYVVHIEWGTEKL